MTFHLLASLMLMGVPEPPLLAVPAEGECRDDLDVAIFTSPRWPDEGTPLRVMVVSEEELPGARLAARGPDGTVHALQASRTSGPPYGWIATIDNPTRGRWRVAIGSGQTLSACQKVYVRRRAGRPPPLIEAEDSVWDARIKWERDTENLYSLWVEHLFDVPPDTEPTWRPLHEVLRKPERNLLFDHLNMGEDGPGNSALRLSPDCADFPYFLRGYFAWKMGLPFGFRACSRGTTRRAPRCAKEPVTNQHPAADTDRVRAFERFIRRECGGHVHSSSGRTLPDDENADYYPVALNRRGVRPGTIFADPYGHVLVVAKWYPQRGGKPGVLFAVDAQPDATVGRRRFWRGSFLFPESGAVTGAGFKRFRPLYKRRRPEGELGETGSRYEIRARSNRWIAHSRDYGDFSVDQWKLGPEGFYERMDALINPEPMPPGIAFRAALDALTEQVRRRVSSVEAAEEWKRARPGATISMPEGTDIFQTAGPWEDYSSPSRDLRLLIAIQTVVDYPGRVERYPDRFVLTGGEEPQAAAERLRSQLLAEARAREFTYVRSDGSPWKLTVADVIERRVGLEMAYNPNDCPERRWAAPEGSDEISTCQGRAPNGQLEKMVSYRSWFRDRRRPTE